MRIPAAAYNSFVDLALAAAREETSIGQPPLSLQRRYDTLIANTGVEDFPRFSIVAMGDPITLPTDRLEGFQARQSVAAAVPAASDRGKFCILQEPIRADAVGRAIASGLAIAKVTLLDPTDQDDDFADVNPGEIDTLLGAAQGSARILWTEAVADRDDPDVAWCIVRLGDQGPGGTFDVLVTIDGGDAGPPCTFTYSVASIRGKVIAAGMTPEALRDAALKYADTPNGSKGLASYDEVGALHLVWANELPLTEDCDSEESSINIDGGNASSTYDESA